MTQLETLSLILSITGLIASIVFGTSIFSLHNTLGEVKIKQKEVETLYDKVVKLAIVSCGTVYSCFCDDGDIEFIIDGHKFVNWVKSKYKILDDYQSTIFIQGSYYQLIEEYIKDNYESIEKRKINPSKQ